MRLEVRSETFVSAREDSLHTIHDECFYRHDLHFTAAVSLDYRISRIRIALRQSSASKFYGICLG